jgi:hypothetical protein
VINKVRRTRGGTKGAEVHGPDEKEVEKTFWLSRVRAQYHGKAPVLWEFFPSLINIIY